MRRLFRELLKAHEYLRLKGFNFDLVVLERTCASYLQDLHDTLTQMVESSPDQGWMDRPGGVFLRRADLMPEEDRTLLRAAARVEMVAADGALREQLKRTAIPFEPSTGACRCRGARPPSRPGEQPRHHLRPSSNSNGIGGFAEGGRQYVVVVNPQRRQPPPVPWVNVVANPAFGFAASESAPATRGRGTATTTG